ncbi:unnamed protein product [Phytophthora lilii]|uniref:Unnamed protein product n=1 Tax=Phytophthora lilii TaxID=2077276 RepID=A0A9W6TGQ6_9STRA|nr:unnamed protein product [Phytophthora lilii]
MFCRRGARLWLAIDEMETMLKNENLISNFMHCLRGWQSIPFFMGFLGVGTSDLLDMSMKLKGGDFISPFNLIEAIEAIMGYSAGVPGVFGSSIRYSIDPHDKCDQERHEWEHWFKIQNFSDYLATHNWTYDKIREDLQKLSQSDWYLLGSLLKNDDSGFTDAFDTGRRKLLQMVVVITSSRNARKLEFSSEMVRRLCLEALPIREISVVAVKSKLQSPFNYKPEVISTFKCEEYTFSHRVCVPV